MAKIAICRRCGYTDRDQKSYHATLSKKHTFICTMNQLVEKQHRMQSTPLCRIPLAMGWFEMFSHTIRILRTNLQDEQCSDTRSIIIACTNLPEIKIWCLMLLEIHLTN